MVSILLGAAVLSGLLIALLAAPVELAFRIDRIRQIHGQAHIRWLFGLVRFSVEVPGIAKPKKTKEKRRPAAAKKSGPHEQKSGSSKLFAVLKQSPFRRRLFRFIKDLLRATHSQELYLRLRVGLGDPADTGQLWALLGPIAALAANMPVAVVRIEPEFMNPVFEFQSHGKFRLSPLEIIALTIAFVLSPPSLRAWRTLRQSKAQ
ncbi:MAG: DUF2953 domain-containing protein [Gammaproteobacteria bacterium]|nr:DUF2953 domain-containing protein [Gammaproteobacteria bacterium]